jgi:hypothetical protein
MAIGFRAVAVLSQRTDKQGGLLLDQSRERVSASMFKLPWDGSKAWRWFQSKKRVRARPINIEEATP